MFPDMTWLQSSVSGAQRHFQGGGTPPCGVNICHFPWHGCVNPQSPRPAARAGDRALPAQPAQAGHPGHVAAGRQKEHHHAREGVRGEPHPARARQPRAHHGARAPVQQPPATPACMFTERLHHSHRSPVARTRVASAKQLDHRMLHSCCFCSSSPFFGYADGETPHSCIIVHPACAAAARSLSSKRK